MKDLQKLAGAKILSKKEQQDIKGGLACWADVYLCPPGTTCINHLCR
ncbi:hypothetical protein [Labilibaculum euxinus]|uniref:Bacteriocin n=1 Tax=Labilibaculum euxinus TaxID=2686357 RepID=A0A7M4DAP1_9BACT|nr:hypothetical protein [Labilibaculum euxinus]MUP39720.1 hypothetical protein [Labilibaculum euxinus]MVB08925.1 hypothetical protein [Labilibaculum euxinus]